MASLSGMINTLPWRWQRSTTGMMISPGVLLLAFVVAAFFLPQLLDSRFRISYDGTFYLSEARYLYDGQGYLVESGVSRLGRPPGFPALLAAAFMLGGPTLDTALVFVRLVGLASVVLVAVLAYRMYGVAAAAIVVAWVASNQFVATYTSQLLLIDMAHTALGLISVWSVFEASRSGKLRLYVLAGAIMAATFWVKESVLFLLPLPFVAALINPDWHTWRHLRGVVAHGFTAILLILPWFGWVYLQAGALYRADSVAVAPGGNLGLGVAGAGGVAAIVVIVAAALVWRRRRASASRMARINIAPSLRAAFGWAVALGLVALATFVAGAPSIGDLAKHFAQRIDNVDLRPIGYLGPWAWAAMLLGWLFILAGAIRRNPGDIILAAALILSIPLVAFVADRNLAPRNYLVLLLLTHVAMGRSIVGLVGWGWSFLKPRLKGGAAAFARAAIAVLFALSFGLPILAIATDLSSAEAGQALDNQRPVSESRAVAQWVRENLSPDERLHLVSSPGGALARFELGESYQQAWINSDWTHVESLESGLKGELPGRNPDSRPYHAYTGVLFMEKNRQIFLGDRETELPNFRVVQVPDLVSGETPEYLAWVSAGADAIFPKAVPEFLVESGLATHIWSSRGGAQVLRLGDQPLPNVLLVNERALDAFDGANDGSLRLSPGLAEALRGWQVVVLDADNSTNPPRRKWCPSLKQAAPDIKCQDGLHGTPAPQPAPPKGANMVPTPAKLTPDIQTLQPGQDFDIVAVYEDGDGAADLRRAYLMINREWNPEGACYVLYNRERNQLHLYDGEWRLAGEPGNGSATNAPACALDPVGSAVSADGDQLSVRFRLRLSTQFSGSYSVWLRAQDINDEWSPIEEAGAITVNPAVPSP